jgi:hypothetical protein
MRQVRLFGAAGIAALAMSFTSPSSGQGERPRVERFTVDVPDGVLRETSVGGHFLEWEEPELVARDMQTFFAGLQR